MSASNSRFLGNTARTITPYTPGEQPQDKRYIKLNTNESPYPPAPAVSEIIKKFRADDLRLYPDPRSTALRWAMADTYSLNIDEVFVGGGSDEVLAYIFMAFFDKGGKVYFPDITYGFYKVYADLFGMEICTIPLKEDFTIDITDYFGLDGNIFIANPNAPTGICLTRDEIERILENNPDRIVVVDEAYIDFSEGETAVPLIDNYDNLLVVQTFSKSRALAGARLGFGFGNPSLMDGLERIKFSFNPYNIDRLSSDIGIAALSDPAYFQTVVENIKIGRDNTITQLKSLGFSVLPSEANFLFASHPTIPAKALYEYLREHGVLVRYFSSPRIDNFLRITIGTPEEMQSLHAILLAYLSTNKEISYGTK